MQRIEPDIAPHMARFLAMLDTAFIRHGNRDGLPVAMRHAVQATPRHHFVHRFRVGDGPLLDADNNLEPCLDTIYSDAVMRHVDRDGELLPSSNSQPSYVLWLLHMLDLRPGHRVLEIGSGSGWLAAVMAHFVGPQGHVTGIEIISDLAAQSRIDLGSVGQANPTILTKDGTGGHADGGPFDRVMITAATWDLPPVLFEQVTPDGNVLVPIELRGTGGCQVTLLRRTGPGFLAQRSIPGWFVPLTGAGQTRSGRYPCRADVPFLRQIPSIPNLRCKLPLGLSASRAAAHDFRAFLGCTEPGFVALETDAEDARGAFGLIDQAANSAALCIAGELTGYGSEAATRRLAADFNRWTDLGLPLMADFKLEVRRADAALANDPQLWVEPRERTALLWSLPPEATVWRALLDDQPPTTPLSQA